MYNTTTLQAFIACNYGSNAVTGQGQLLLKLERRLILKEKNDFDSPVMSVDLAQRYLNARKCLDEHFKLFEFTQELAVKLSNESGDCRMPLEALGLLLRLNDAYAQNITTILDEVFVSEDKVKRLLEEGGNE